MALTIEERLLALEAYVADILPRLKAVEADQQTIKANTEEILDWIRGARTVYGFAVSHWRNLAKVGSGVLLAAGYMSPRVHDIIAHVFWLPS